ncbi:MAG TPA: hypothetical protein VLA44_09525, partial [Clostridia bacterium]|nr:hypothetical protein [Clostridia bacterium]
MAAHARGAPAYAAVAVGLAAPDDAEAAAREALWQLERADPEVRDVLRRLPAPPRSRGTLGRLIEALHAALTGSR